MRFIVGLTVLIVWIGTVNQAFANVSDVREYWLDNGMLVLLKENHNSPIINFNVAYRVGAKYDPIGRTGLSHYLEHMMFKNTENLACDEFRDRLSAVGAFKNAYTNLDKTVYHETIAADQIDLALELEAERMQNLQVLEEERQSEMTVIRNEMVQYEDNTFAHLYERLLNTAYMAHPYRDPILGWCDDVETITTDDLMEYYDRYYHPDNAFIVAVGDFECEEMLAKIDRYFGRIPASGCVKPHITPEPEQSGERRFEIHRPGQADMLMMGWHIPASTNPDNYALVELADILGTGITSRLYPQLVENNLCSEVMCFSKAYDFQDPSLFITCAVLNPEVSLEEVEGIILDEFESIKTGGVTEDELIKAKKLQRVYNILNRDDVRDEADTIADFEYLSSWRDAANYMPGIEEVTGEDIVRVAREYLVRDNMTVGYYRTAAAEAAGPEAEVVSDDRAYHNLPDSTFPSAGAGVQNVAFSSMAAAEQPYATEYTLSNGMQVIIRENHNNESVSLAMMIPGGKASDPMDRPGLANLTTVLLKSGTANYTKREIGELLEFAGISIDFNCEAESLDATSASLTEDFPLMLGMLSEMLLQPSFDEEEVEMIRGQMTGHIQRGMSSASSVSQRTARELLYGEDNPFHSWLIGTPESMAAITRDDCLSWHDQCVRPAGSVLAIVGDVDPVETIALIEQHFGKWQGALAGYDELIAEGAHYRLDAERRTEIAMPGRRNAVLLWAGPGTNKAGADWAAVNVAISAFGNGMNSRLNKRLRGQDGLTYGASAFLKAGRASGLFFVTVPVNPGNIDRAIAATEEELARYATEGITEEELESTKSFMAGAFPVELSNNGKVAYTLCKFGHLGLGVENYVGFCDAIRNVTKEEVDAAAAQLADPENLKLIIAGELG